MLLQSQGQSLYYNDTLGSSDFHTLIYAFR
jgi:hypothetical protein